MLSPPNRMGNRILDRLSKSEYEPLIGSEKPVVLASGKAICEQDGPGSLHHVYFPTSGMVSLTIIMKDGKEVEVATIGNEGMIGLALALGLDSSPVRAVGQISGGGLLIPAAAFLKAMKPDGTLDNVMRRYAAYSLRYANQIVACNLLHSVEERLCRWLLMSHDRVGGDEFALTHEFISEMLGVRRQTVTAIAGTLQAAGLLAYRRGIVQVLNRQGLEAATCECYGVTSSFYDRIMKQPAS